MLPQLHTPGRLHLLLQISNSFATALFAMPFFPFGQHYDNFAHPPKWFMLNGRYSFLPIMIIFKSAIHVNSDCLLLIRHGQLSYMPALWLMLIQLAFALAKLHFVWQVTLNKELAASFARFPTTNRKIATAFSLKRRRLLPIPEE